MITQTKEKKVKRRIFEMVFALLIFSLFLFIVFNYYGTTQKAVKGNPRFVVIDSKELQEEASLINVNRSLGNETAKNVFVLTYHVISPGPPKDDYEISYDQFKENMFTLKRLGYQTVSLDDLYLFMNGEKELPDKSFLLTFDDGAKAGFYNADEILEVLNYTAVMFVITGHSLEEKQSAYYLNKPELMKVEQTGRWELESHTSESHFRLPVDSSGKIAPILTNKLWISQEKRLETDEEFYIRVKSDLEKSKNLLETNFNKTVVAFALPYGDFGKRGSNYANANTIVYLLTTSIYKLVFYEFPIKDIFYRGNYPSANEKSYLIGRLPADSLRTPDQLLKRIEASRTLELPYLEDYLNDERWVRISGIASFKKNSIILKPLEGSSDSLLFAYLDGSYLWKDYDYSIQLINTSIETVFLLSRLNDEGDYVECKYDNGFVEIIRVNNNAQTKIAKEINLEGLSLGTNLTISVYKSQVICLIDGKEIVSAEVSGMPAYGGVGVKTGNLRVSGEIFEFGNIKVEEKR